MRRQPNLFDDQQYKSFIRRVSRTDRNGNLEKYPDLDTADFDSKYPHFKRALQNHEMWHQRQPSSAYEKHVQFPKSLVCIGKAHEIIYISDKWEEHADFFSYVHSFDSHPEVYGDANSFSDFPIGKPKSTAKLINVKDVNDSAKLAAPILARVAEFSLFLNDDYDTPYVLRFDFPPLMICSPDMEGLIILSDNKGPIVVKGGQMEITQRGIVK